jgi:hypothetical protein
MKADYTPDAWVVIKIGGSGTTPVYKILAGWYGGYTTGDSWRLSSGIIKYKEFDDYYKVTNFSGSIYDCLKSKYRLIGITSGIFEQLKKNAELQDATVSICYMMDVK